MLIGTLAELVTIGAVVPLIGLLARPEAATELPFLGGHFQTMHHLTTPRPGVTIALSFLAVVVVATGVRLLLTYTSNRLIYGIGHDISIKLYATILDQPYTYHIQRNSSETLAAVTKAQLVLVHFLWPLMQGMISVAAASGIVLALVFLNPAIALGAGFTLAAIYFSIILLFRSLLRRNGKAISRSQDERLKIVQEGLGGIRDVLLNALKRHYVAAFTEVDYRLRQAQATNQFLSQAPRSLVEMIGIALLVALALMLAQRPQGLVAALPMLGALTLGAARLLPLMQQIYQASANISGNLSVVEDILELLDLPRRAYDATSQPPLPFETAIELRNLQFQYPAEQSVVLQNINLRFPKGSRVGIVGTTGSGKSTLTDVIMGFLRPTTGEVLIDGVRLDESTEHGWQRRVCHVPQHVFLSDMSIAENIALGVSAEMIDHERVQKAARIAQIADYIDNHRDGYRTRVGERGVQLSGGQRQRIGIARALYKDADVLVFDEASSALDVNTENALMDAIGALSRELTIFVIAHRFHTLRNCDVILRVEDGHVLEMSKDSTFWQDHYRTEV